MTMAKPVFPKPDFWLPILHRLSELPEDQMPSDAAALIRDFLQRPPAEITSADVWGFLKKLQDFLATRNASHLVMTTINVAPHYTPPPGC